MTCLLTTGHLYLLYTYLHIGKSSVLMVLDSFEVDTFQLALYYNVNEIHSLIALRSITKA